MSPAEARPLRRLFALGFGLHLALVAALVAGAYLGWLPTTLPAVPHADLLGHAGLIGLLAFFLDGLLGGRPVTRRVPALGLAPALVLLVAGIEELCQLLSPRRTASVLDFAADVAGVVLCTWLARRALARAAAAAARRAAAAAKSGTAGGI
ncbi:MAG TPA: VanZ family protein [Polyangia bacterium]